MTDLSGIAQNIYDELGNPSGISVSYISGYLYTNIGKLNNEINTSYVAISGTIVPDMGAEEIDIYKEIFDIKYYDRAINSNIGAAGVDWIELQEGDSKIRRTSKNDFAKTYLGLKKNAQDQLNLLVSLYRMNNAVPAQVVGDDASGIYPYRRDSYGYRN